MARTLLVFVSIVALLALTIGPSADSLPFDILIPFWFVIAAVVIARVHLVPANLPVREPLLTTASLRAPPLQ